MMIKTTETFIPEICENSGDVRCFFHRLKQASGGDAEIREREPMARRTTLRVGGAADFYVEPRSETALTGILRLCREEQQPVLVLGRGSNLLVRDGGIRGVVIGLCQPFFCRIQMEDRGLWAGAGARLKDVAHAARRQGWTGLEFLEGIPGSIGGALRMNAGAMGSATFDRVRRIRTMDREGTPREFERDQIQASYRHCPILAEEIALGAWLHGEPADEARIRETMERWNRARWESQPPQPSAGCIFRNPEGAAAGRIVDELGLKGSREGGACVSDVHGNFIVNDRGATASDVLRLIDRVRRAVFEARGIELRTEVEIVGTDVASEPGTNRGGGH